MTDNERELIQIIRESANPSETLMKAFELIFDALQTASKNQEHSSACPQELVGTD